MGTGGSSNMPISVQYTVTERTLVDELVPVLGENFGEIRPAATMVVAGLIKPEMKVEIEVTAFKGFTVH